MGRITKTTKSKPQAKKPAKKAVPAKSAAKKAPARAVAATSAPRAGLTTMERLRKELLKRREEIISFQHNMEEHGTTNNDEPGDIVDRSEEVEVWMTRESMNQHVTDELRHIDAALARMQAGEFGVCESCEEQIPLSRLRARPNATLCLSCQEMNERHNVGAFRRPAVPGLPA